MADWAVGATSNLELPHHKEEPPLLSTTGQTRGGEGAGHQRRVEPTVKTERRGRGCCNLSRSPLHQLPTTTGTWRDSEGWLRNVVERPANSAAGRKTLDLW
ncbi:hypothetical protein CRG98_006873 [Punica granatum]|uniref:Uncharacterized protein n=1 Tax=Punica granatum TaxID=22663 RepID=A0A2I0KY29_PUNGR|nr:hypothetical protein CRG98_006873 [Punica granatum]